MKSGVIWKRILTALALGASLSAAVILFWYGFKYMPYRRMAEKMQPDNGFERPRYVYMDDQYLYRLKMPGYLSFESGFLYVGPADEKAATFTVDENGSMTEENVPHVDMFIWPQIVSSPLYGVTIYEENWSRQYMMNGQGEYLPDESVSNQDREEALALFEKHRSEIHDVLQAANALWGKELGKDMP